MTFLKLLPVIISLLILGAHFSRVDIFPLTLLCLGLPFLLFIKRAWVARLTQIALVLGAIEWVRITLVYVGERQVSGQPWIRLAIILGIVALLTGLSALMFQTNVLIKRYKLK